MRARPAGGRDARVQRAAAGADHPAADGEAEDRGPRHPAHLPGRRRAR